MRSAEHGIVAANVLVGCTFLALLLCGPPPFLDGSSRWASPLKDPALLLTVAGLAFGTASAMRRRARARWVMEAATLSAAAFAIVTVAWFIP
jgi:hypothetical protein